MMKSIILLLLINSNLINGQRNVGEQLAGSLAGALLNTFFPQLKPATYFGQNSPPSSPLSQFPPPRPINVQPGQTQNLPVALTGVGRLPPVDFPHGFPPTFVGLTNPENQNGFNIPTGLQGRTDLPPDYVYPFAPPGSVIRPDENNGEIFSLGARNRPVPPAPPAPSQLFSNQFGQLSPGAGLPGLVGPGLDWSQLQQPVIQQPIDNTALLQPIGPTSLLLNNVQVAPAGPVQSPSARVSNQRPSPKQAQAQRQDTNYGTSCPECIPIDLRRLAGPWIQVYGNPSVLRNIYTAIVNLQSLYGDESTNGQTSAIQPSCIGMQLGRPETRGGNHSESSMDLYFRDDTINRQLHEVTGVLKQNANISPKNVLLKLPAFELPVCLVKAGPETSTMYGYIILTETLGANRCRSFHVFARRSDSFFRDYNVEVGEYIKSKVESNLGYPVSVLPFPELCQLPTLNSEISR